MIKIEHTKTYATSIVEETYPSGVEKGIKSTTQVLVTDAELVLVKNTIPPADVYVNSFGFHPYLISRIEKIEVGDSILSPDKREIIVVKELLDKPSRWFDLGWRNILALPEHFSLQTLQDIVDGKLKEGKKKRCVCEEEGVVCNMPEHSLSVEGKCLVECEMIDWDSDMVSGYGGENLVPVIKLNPHITVYSVEEKIYTKEEVKTLFDKWNDDLYNGYYVAKQDVETMLDQSDKWFEQNVK